MLFLIPATTTPVFASNSQALTLSIDSSGTSTFTHRGTPATDSHTLVVDVKNPSGNAFPINSITLTAPTGWDFNGTAPGNCGTVFGGTWTIVYSDSAVSCTSPGATHDISPGFTGVLTFGPVDAPSTANGASAVSGTFTDSVTDTSGSGAYSSGTLTVQGVAKITSVTLSPSGTTTFIAGSSAISYTLTISSDQSGVIVGLSASGTNAGTVSASSATTGSGGTATFTYAPSNTADSTPSHSVVTAKVNGTSGTANTITLPGAPSTIDLSLSGYSSGHAFPSLYNVTSSYRPGAKSNYYATVDTSKVAYALADAFGNNVTSGVSFTSGTLSGGNWNNNSTTSITTTSKSIPYSALLSGQKFNATRFIFSGTYGATSAITMTIIGSYNGVGFSATGSSGTLSTSLFDSTAHQVSILGSRAVGSTISVDYQLADAQPGVAVTFIAHQTGNVSTGFTNGKWVGGATAYDYSNSRVYANVTDSTSTAGLATASFLLPTRNGTTIDFTTKITYTTDTTPYTGTVLGTLNSTKTLGGTVSNFGVQVLFDSDAGSVASSVLAGKTVYIVAYITDSYGNLVGNPGTQLQVQITVTSGSLGSTTPFIASDGKLTNGTGGFGLDAWAIPASASGTLTVTASGLYATGTTSITVVSPNPTVSISSVNGKAYTSGTVYTHSSSIAVNGKAATSVGYESGDDSISNVYASLNGAAFYSFGSGTSWTYVNAVALKANTTNTVVFVSSDGTYNSSQALLNVIYDPKAPTITFPTNLNISSGQSLSVTITTGANDLNSSSIAVSVNGTALASSSFSFSGSTLTINGLTAGHKSVAVSASTLAGLSATVTKVVTVILTGIGTFTSTAGATSCSSSGFTGACITLTNNAAASETVNVYFQWENSANQVVNVGGQLNVVFSAGQSQSFFGAYTTAGTYTVHVVVQDASGNALSQSYTVTVTVP